MAPEAKPPVPAAPLAPPPLRHCPMVAAAVLLDIGIVLGRYVIVPTALWAVAGLAGLIAAGMSFRRVEMIWLTRAAVAAVIVAGGAFSAALACRHIAADHIVRYSSQADVLVTIRGRILEPPRIEARSAGYYQPPMTSFLLEARQILARDGQWRPVSGLVAVQVEEPADKLAMSDTVELCGTLRRPRGPGNPGQFDWAAYHRRQGLLVKLVVPCAAGASVLDARSGVAARLLGNVRLLARQSVLAGDEEDQADLVTALVLGDRDKSLQQLNQQMVEAGTVHMLSISGTHFGIFLGFVYGLCRLLTLPPRRCGVLVLIVLIAYLLLTTPSPPLLRSALMAAAFCLAVILGRQISTANALAGAAVVLLVVAPLDLFSPGFQLSFGVVAGIVLLQEPIKRWLFGRTLRRQGLVVYRDGTPGRRYVRYLRHTLSRWGMATVCVSLGAWAASLPLVAYHFGLFSPYAAITTLILTPVMACVLVPAYVALALSWLLPNLAGVASSAAGHAAAVMQHMVGWMARWPGISFDLYSIPVWAVVTAYAALLLWALRHKGRAFAALAAACAVATAVGVCISQRPAEPPQYARLHVLDVSHGAMALLQGPDGRTTLFDAGTLGSTNAYNEILRPFLRTMRLPSPSTLFVSHANTDHFNALPALLERHRPERLCVNETFGKNSDDAPTSLALLEQCRGRGVEIVRTHGGAVLPLCPGLDVQVVWPPLAPAEKLDANEGSLVLRVDCPAGRILIPGDIGRIAQEHISRELAAQAVSAVLVLPHHGGVTPLLQSFIAAVNPALLVQSNSYRRESPTLLQAIAGRKRLATFREGWICVELTDQGPKMTCMRPERMSD